MRDQIRILVEEQRGHIISFFQEIVALRSPGGAEGPVIERIRSEMDALGYDEIRIDALGNLIGRIGTGERVLVFDGHCDTVAAGDLAAWSGDPYSGALQGNCVYGRGSVDQKGGLAAAVYAGALVKEIGLPADVSIYVVASVLEEDFEGVCWQHLIETEHLRPEAVILTEPSNNEIRVGHRGRMEINLRVRGVSSHGSQPDKGENAIYRIMPVVREIEQLHRSLSGPAPLGPGSITVTGIRSRGPSLCAVPDLSEIHLDRRLTAGETMESCLEEIRNLPSVKEISAELEVPEHTVTSRTGFSCRQKAFYPAWLVPESEPLVQAAAAAYGSQFEKPARTGVWRFSTNGVATNGLFQIPTIGFGPGDEGAAHAPNESLSVEELLDAARFYIAIGLEWGASGRH